jgi:hypothetical protein
VELEGECKVSSFDDDTDYAARYWQGQPPRAEVIAEAVIADSVRFDTVPAPTPGPLPTDSAERKRTPLCTGLLDYFPDLLREIASECTNFAEPEEGFAAAALECLMARGADTCVQPTVRGAFFALLMLEEELSDRELQYSDWSTVFGLDDLFALAPRALAAVAQVSWYGNEKHNPGQPLHHARGKSMDHADCIVRHLVERGGFDGKLRHSACHAWRWFALGQEELEQKGAPLARGAVLP